MRIGASNYSLLKSYGEEKSIEILAKAGFDCIDYNFESCDEFNNKKLFVGTTDDEFDAYFMHVKKVLDEKYFRYYKIDIYNLISFERFLRLLKFGVIEVSLISRISKSGEDIGRYRNKKLVFRYVYPIF